MSALVVLYKRVFSDLVTWGVPSNIQRVNKRSKVTEYSACIHVPNREKYSTDVYDWFKHHLEGRGGCRLDYWSLVFMPSNESNSDVLHKHRQ